MGRSIEHSKELFFAFCKRKFHSPSFILILLLFALLNIKRIRPEESPKKIRSFCELLLHNVRSVKKYIRLVKWNIDCNSCSDTRRNKKYKNGLYLIISVTTFKCCCKCLDKKDVYLCVMVTFKIIVRYFIRISTAKAFRIRRHGQTFSTQTCISDSCIIFFTVAATICCYWHHHQN